MRSHKKFLALLCLVAFFSFAGCADDDALVENTEAGAEGDGTEVTAEGDCAEGVVTTESGLQIEDIQCGEGDEATAGQLVTVHYVGTLEDGTQFDSSRDRGEPFEFPLGGGQVIQGWDEGVVGMRVGGERRLTIPPELGYGATGAGDAIPPNATLIFDIELLALEEISG